MAAISSVFSRPSTRASRVSLLRKGASPRTPCQSFRGSILRTSLSRVLALKKGARLMTPDISSHSSAFSVRASRVLLPRKGASSESSFRLRT